MTPPPRVAEHHPLRDFEAGHPQGNVEELDPDSLGLAQSHSVSLLRSRNALKQPKRQWLVPNHTGWFVDM